MRSVSAIIVLAAAIIVGFYLGRFFTGKEDKTELTENYSFVREIAELASIEVTGTTSLNSTNLNNDGTLTDEFRRIFAEKTVRLSAPYTAKYGVDLGDSSLRIERTDSLLKVFLPPPKLLSYELHLNRLQASNQKGFFQFANDDTYNAFQKKMYTDSRSQLEKNERYLSQSRDRICSIIQKYFVPMKIKTVCIYEVRNGVNWKN